jgi:membrane protease YdiL (CAAX protease family)
MGLVIGIVGVGIIFALESFLGLVNWQWKNIQRLLSLALPILIVGLGVGFIEELVFRGFIIYELASDYTYLTAAIASSAIFALLHLVWERQETIPQLPGLWLMGMVLAGARLVDGGSLGLAWGLHAGWIWGLSCLDSAELLTYTAKEVTWISGMNRQPLAGLAGILCLVGTGFFLWLMSMNSIV